MWVLLPLNKAKIRFFVNVRHFTLFPDRKYLRRECFPAWRERLRQSVIEVGISLIYIQKIR